MGDFLETIERLLKWSAAALVGGLIVFGVLRFRGGESVEEEPWKQVQNQNTIEAYLEYLKECEACPRKEEAEASLDAAQKVRGMVARLARNHMPIRAGISLPEFSPDGRKVMAAGGRDIDFWDVKTGELRPHREGGFAARTGRYFETLAYSPDGTRIAAGMSGTENGTLLAWNEKSGELLADYVLEGFDVKVVAFGPQGTTVGWLAQGPLGVWEPETGKFLRAVHEGATAMAFTATEKNEPRMLTVSGRELWFWDIASLEPVKKLEVNSDRTLLGVSSDGRMVAYFEANVLELWDTATAAPVATLSEHDGEVTSFCREPKRGWIAVGTKLGSLYLWDPASGKLIGHVPAHEGPVEQINCSARAQLASTGWDSAKIWDLEKLKRWHELREIPN